MVLLLIIIRYIMSFESPQESQEKIMDYPITEHLSTRERKDTMSGNILGVHLINSETGEALTSEYTSIDMEGPALIGIDHDGVYILDKETGKVIGEFAKVGYKDGKVVGTRKETLEEVVVEVE